MTAEERTWDGYVEVKARVTLVINGSAFIKDPRAHDCLIRFATLA